MRVWSAPGAFVGEILGPPTYWLPAIRLALSSVNRHWSTANRPRVNPTPSAAACSILRTPFLSGGPPISAFIHWTTRLQISSMKDCCEAPLQVDVQSIYAGSTQRASLCLATSFSARFEEHLRVSVTTRSRVPSTGQRIAVIRSTLLGWVVMSRGAFSRDGDAEGSRGHNRVHTCSLLLGFPYSLIRVF